MRKNRKSAKIWLLALFGICSLSTLTNCTKESDFIGGLVEMPIIPTPPPASDTIVTEVAQDSVVAMFATRTFELYTVEQKVCGKFLKKMGDDVLDSTEFQRELDLNAMFNAPQKIYVPTADDIANVSLSTIKKGEATVTSEEDGSEFVRFRSETPFTFVMNKGEEVVAQAYFEKDVATCSQKDLCYTAITNVQIKTATAEKNDSLTNADSVVYDVKAIYNVDLLRHIKDSTSLETYEVTVPYQRVHLVGDAFVGKRVGRVERKIISDSSERIIITTYEEWSLSGKINEVKDSIDLPIVLNAPQKQMVLAENARFETSKATISYGEETSKRDGNWTVKTKPFTYTSVAQNNEGTSFNNVYSGSSCAVTYQRDTLNIELGYGTWTVAQEQTNLASNPQDVDYEGETYDGYAYANNLELSYNVQQGAETTISVMSEATILIAKDKLLGKDHGDVHYEVVDDNTDKVTWEETEHWSKSGDKTIQKEWIRQRHFYAPNEQTVTTLNKDYSKSVEGPATIREERSTQGALMVTTRYLSYTVNFENGLNPFSVVYKYDMQSAVYTDPDNFYTLTFDFPEWTVEENSVEISESPVREGTYNVYKHTHKVMHTYTVGDASQNGNAEALTNLKLLAKNIPDSWGTIRSFGISVVPADDVNGQFAKKAFCLVTDNGAVAVVFDYGRDLPTVDEINNGNFVNGSYSPAYNSAYWAGQWRPAIAKDDPDGICYYEGGTPKALVNYDDLGIWPGWQHGKTTVVTGYNISVQNGVLSVKAPNGNSLQLF